MKVKLLLILLAVALVAGLVLFSSDRSLDSLQATPAPQEPPKETPVAQAANERQPALPAPTLAPQARASSGPSVKLIADFSSSKDWRAFASMAKSRPEEGGYFYAMYVSSICGMGIASRPDVARQAIAGAVAKSGTVGAAEMEMTGRLQTLCSSFSPDEASNMYRETRQAVSDRRDPIVNAIQNLSEATTKKDEAKVRDALQKLMALDDPVAPYTSELLIAVMHGSAGAKTPADMWFDGKVYAADDPLLQSSLRLGLAAASCRKGVPCQLDAQLMLGCLGGQFCTDSRQEYLRHQYVKLGGMSESVFEDSLRLGDRIQEAVSARQADAFVR